MVSVLGGKLWSVLLKGRGIKWMLGFCVLVDLMYWMFNGVLRIVMVKFVTCWIFLASSKNGIRWPWAKNGSIIMCASGLPIFLFCVCFM